MPCRQLIPPGHPKYSTLDPRLSVDIGLSPFSRSPSPFALFTNRINFSQNVSQPDRNNGFLTFGHENREQTRLRGKLSRNKGYEHPLNITILLPNPYYHNLRRVAGFGMEVDNNGWLLMVAPRPRLNDEGSRGRRKRGPSSAAGSAEVRPLSNDPVNVNVNPVSIKLEAVADTCCQKQVNEDTTHQENKEELEETNIKPIFSTTTTTTSLDLLPIKKRRLRQIVLEQEQELLSNNSNHESITNSHPGQGINFATTSSSQSEQYRIVHNPPQPQQSSLTTATETLLPGLSFSSQSSATSTSTSTIFLNGTPIPYPNPRPAAAAAAPIPVKPVRRRPIYIGDRRSQTFIDIESQRWWDRAHLAYPFHPKKKGGRNPRPKGQDQSQPIDDPYHEDDPRSQHYQAWLKGFYPDNVCPTNNLDGEPEAKNLLEKLGLANPVAKMTWDEEPVVPLYPPWVTSEALKEFDITNLDSESRIRNSQKFQYD